MEKMPGQIYVGFSQDIGKRKIWDKNPIHAVSCVKYFREDIVETIQNELHYEVRTYEQVMLRDWFAGMALQGLMAKFGPADGIEDAGRMAYLLADSMLKARNADQKQETE